VSFKNKVVVLVFSKYEMLHFDVDIGLLLKDILVVPVRLILPIITDAKKEHTPRRNLARGFSKTDGFNRL